MNLNNVILNLFQNRISERHCDPESSSGRRNLFAFTLAEVLITLAIIGVVAAMTIPTLMNNAQNKANITGLKKTYSELLQVTELIKIDGENVEDWIPDSGAAGDNELANIYAKKMNVVKNCSEAGITNCFGNSYTYLSGANYPYLDNTKAASILLSDGTSMNFSTFGKSGNTTYGNAGTDASLVYGDIYVDVNGPKKPNTLGKDVFSFFISKKTLIPYGSTDIKTGSAFEIESCKKGGSGHGCAGWVLSKENMDYP